MSEMFEKASRLKLRYAHKGVCTVEDLWDIPITQLDSIFKTCNAKARIDKEESLLATRKKEDAVLELQIDIIRHIVEVRLEEAKEVRNRKDRADKKQKLLAIIEDKQDAELKDMDINVLKKLAEDL